MCPDERGVHTGDGIVKSLLGKVTSLIRGVQDFIIKHGEVEGQSEADRMGWGKVSLRDFGCVLVGLQRFIGGFLALVTEGELSQVAVVITLPRLVLVRPNHKTSGLMLSLHLVVENLRLARLRRGNQMFVKDFQDIFTDLGQLGLNLLTVLFDQSNLRFVAFRLLLLFNRSHDPPGCAPGPNDILVGHRKEISLFHGEFLVGRGNILHVLDHFYGMLSILHVKTVLEYVMGC